MVSATGLGQLRTGGCVLWRRGEGPAGHLSRPRRECPSWSVGPEEAAGAGYPAPAVSIFQAAVSSTTRKRASPDNMRS